MKNTSRKAAAVMPVSAKYYTRLQQRVSSIVAALHLPVGNSCETDVMNLINRYFENRAVADNYAMGCAAGNPSAHTTYIIFLTLRAEIDTAIARSRRAREAAARRRARAAALHLPEAATSTPPAAATPSSAATPPSDQRLPVSDLSVNSKESDITNDSRQSELSERSELSESSESSELSERSELSELSAPVYSRPTPPAIRRFRCGIKAKTIRPTLYSKRRR